MLIQGLLMQRADPNRSTQKDQPQLGLSRWTTPLAICCLFKHHEASWLLISARASVDGRFIHTPMFAATIANDPEGIRLLCDANCSPLQRNFFANSPFEAAASHGSLAALEELVKQTEASGEDVDLSTCLHGAMFQHGGNAHMVCRLLDLRADVNAQGFDWLLRTVVGRGLYVLKLLQHRVGTATALTKFVYHSRGATPLMVALLSSHYEGAACLIARGAKLDLRNRRGWVAEDFVKGRVVPPFLRAALEGQFCPLVKQLAPWSPSETEDGYVVMRF